MNESAELAAAVAATAGVDLALAERHMRYAIRLAACSAGRTAPNPGVGCVLANGARVLGAGRHERCGEAHGEINALADCRDHGHDPRGAIAYVTLAPCTRHGRTPPCVDALIDAGVAGVVAAIADPVQDDAGERLSAAGVAYHSGFMRTLAAHVHGGFLSRVTRRRPRVTAKWAMTLDGAIASHSGNSQWISSPEALSLSRRRRRGFDAIVVGGGTARADNPRLLALADRHPIRVVIDDAAMLPADSHLLATVATAPVWVVHGPQAAASQLASLADAGVTTIAVANPRDPLAVAAQFGERGLNDVLVEGGASIHGDWLRAGVVDRVECYLAARSLGGGWPVAIGPGADQIAAGSRWQLEQAPRVLGDTVLLRYAIA